jgi:Txe/YoeB family toxin of Txe-Axe toxin-antitoxin module
MITNQTYKYWILSGKKNDGTDVNAKELKLWKEFDKLMNKKGLYFIFKNLNDANFKGTPKFNKVDVEYNRFYYNWVWKQVHAVYPNTPAEPTINTAGEPA